LCQAFIKCIFASKILEREITEPFVPVVTTITTCSNSVKHACFAQSACVDFRNRTTKVNESEIRCRERASLMWGDRVAVFHVGSSRQQQRSQWAGRESCLDGKLSQYGRQRSEGWLYVEASGGGVVLSAVITS